jgi:fructose-1-phosphate kinase PfkB-like protein
MNAPDFQTAAIATFTPNPAIDVSTSVERVDPNASSGATNRGGNPVAAG